MQRDDPSGRAIARLASGGIGGPPNEALELVELAWPELARFVQQRLVYRGAPRRSLGDCGQNVFRRVWKYRQGYRGATESEWWGWVRRITDNELRRWLESERRHPVTQTDLDDRVRGAQEDDPASDSLAPMPDAADPTFDTVENREAVGRIRGCLGRLTGIHRKVIEQIYLRGGLSERAVAELLECSPSYVHKLKAQALERLRQCMEAKANPRRTLGPLPVPSTRREEIEP